MTETGTELETFIRLCCEVLGVEAIAPEDNFFELGGDSISAIELSSYATMVLGRQIEIASIFEAGTIAEIVDRHAQPGRHG